MPILEMRDVVVNYGNINALKQVSFTIEKGETITLIGSNGAGKTTTLNAIMGLLPLAAGEIRMDGESIKGADTRKIVRKGMVLAPEGRQIFAQFSVLDNLLMGGFLRTDKENQAKLREVLELFPVLNERLHQMGGTLSGGEQQMLAVGRALMANPRVLLLDEPSLGLAPLIINDIFRMIQRICAMGVTILLVEQNAKMALKISDRAYILETGKIVLSDTAQSLLNSDVVRKAYLGG